MSISREIQTKEVDKVLIFVDLDEVLIHTINEFWGETPNKDAVEITLSDGDVYKTVHRNGSNYFLSILRNIGDVYMLTSSTEDYAQTMNTKFNFGFTPETIYSREDLQGGYTLNKTGKAVLFDNLHKSENAIKIRFLKQLDLTYIQLQPFYNNKTGAFTHKLIEQLTKQIPD